VDTAKAQHGLGAIRYPTHAGMFHTIFDHMSTSPFDDSRDARITGFQVFMVGHSMTVVLKIPTYSFQLFHELFEKCFVPWVSSLTGLLPGEVVAIDGKTLCRSHDQADSKRATHMVSAWSTSNALVLGSYKTEEKSNEITAIPKRLEILCLEGSLVTIDAMGG
jgi:hypothetical protein